MWNSVPTQILTQLGGKRFVVMTGVKQLIVVGSEEGLGMKLPRNQSGATHLRITLIKHKDLYKVEFLRMRGVGAIKTVAEYDDVYNDQLVQLFEQETGIYTRL
jgi:hypothetical protein